MPIHSDLVHGMLEQAEPHLRLKLKQALAQIEVLMEENRELQRRLAGQDSESAEAQLEWGCVRRGQ